MVPMFSSLQPVFIQNKAFKTFTKFFSFRQIFYALQSIAYTENLGLRHYVGFSQIRSQIIYIINIFITELSMVVSL